MKRRVRSGSTEALLAHLHDVLFEEEGVKKFSDSYESLLKTLAEKEKAMRVA